MSNTSTPTPPLAVQEHSTETTGQDGFRETSVRHTSAEQITSYADAAPSTTSTVAVPDIEDLWTASNSLPNQEMQAVLSRSYQIGVFSWNLETFGDALIDNMDVVATLLGIPQIADKVSYYHLFRCRGVKLTVRLNSTAFHYGCLALSSTVNNSYAKHNPTDGFNYGYLNNRCVLVDANQQQAVDYIIPWSFQQQWVQPNDLPPHILTFKLAVAVALSIIGTTLVPAQVTVFASFVEPQVCFPMSASAHPPVVGRNKYARSKKKQTNGTRIINHTPLTKLPLEPQSRRSNPEARTKASDQSAVSDVQSFLGTIFSVTENIADLAAKIAPLASFVADKPTSVTTSFRTATQWGQDIPSTKGIDYGVALAGDPEARLGESKGVVGDAISTPSLYSVLRTPGYLDQIQWTASTGEGTRLYVRNLSIQGLSAKLAAVENPTPLQWYCMPFAYWRGSLKFLIHFVGSSLITSRLRIVWIPPESVVPVTVPDNESGDWVSKVVEVTGSMDVTFTIPWISKTLYKETGTLTTGLINWIDVTSNDDALSLGTLAVYLVAPVVSADSTITPTVTGLVYVAGGEDFKVNSFSSVMLSEGDSIAVVPAAVPPPPLEPQTSVYTVFESTFDPIVDCSYSMEEGIATSESFASLIDLCKRYSLEFVAGTGNPVTIIDDFDWFYTPAGTVWLSSQPYGFQRWLACCFVNYRGSMRHKVMNSPATGATPSSIAGNTELPCGTPTATFNFSPVSVITEGFTSTVGNNKLEATTLWNSAIPFYAPSIGSDHALGLETSIYLTDTVAATNAHLFRAFGDDFSMGVFQCPPTLAIYAPPLEKEEVRAPAAVRHGAVSIRQ